MASVCAIVIMVIGLAGVWNFCTGFRTKKKIWWEWLVAIVSVLMIAEGIFAIYNPTALKFIFS
ncbi:MAG: hypothetical protein K2K36_08830 [Muribaculaceae bacterium]|nr:hypothetical protein [Muribaculaceae bacterium]